MKGPNSEIREATARPGKRGRKALAALSLSAVLLGVGATQASAVVTTSRAGSVGNLLSYGAATCLAADGNVRQVTAPGTRVSRAPSYPNSNQIISTIPRVEYWNGSAWTHYVWGTWRSFTVAPGYSVNLPGQTFSVPRGYTWRVSTTYRWKVGSALIGEVTNYYERFDYNALDSRSTGVRGLQGEIVIGNTGAGQSSWCYMP